MHLLCPEGVCAAMPMKGHGITFGKTESGRRWTYSCECGWNDREVCTRERRDWRTYATEAVCVGAAVKHVHHEMRLRDRSVDGIRGNVTRVA